MMHFRPLCCFLLSILGPALAAAQTPLPLEVAVREALASNPDMQAAAAASREADARAGEARAGYLPRIDLVESWQRSNQPVAVFSSLLAARQFTAPNFAITALNNPAAIDAHRVAVTAEQTLFDGWRTRASVGAARAGRDIAQAALADARGGIVLATTEAYGRTLLASLMHDAAVGAREAAEQDLARARARRDVGMATDADVLSLDVHLAQVREREIRTANDRHVGLADLNRLTGAPLDRDITLQEVVTPATTDVPSDVASVVARRPDVQRARAGETLAQAGARMAASAFLPQVVVAGGYEANGLAWGDRATSWMVGGQVRWNLLAGGADRARVRAADAAAERAAAERRSAESRAALDLLRARANAEAARARVAVGQAAAAEARESQRMIRDRYEAGLATVTDVLRAATAVLDADAQAASARVDVIVTAAALQRALGLVP